MASAEDTSITESSFLNSTYQTMNESVTVDGSVSTGPTDEELREQDRFLPIANVARIMKKAIPNNGKISKEAKECAQECVSEFISFITSEASDRCSQEKRKTINGEDILYAMSTLGFDNYVEPLKVYLSKYRESTKDRGVTGPVSTDDPMFSDGGAIIALGGDGTQGQNVIYSTYPTQYISAATLDTD